jgi:hypothetical protein
MPLPDAIVVTAVNTPLSALMAQLAKYRTIFQQPCLQQLHRVQGQEIVTFAISMGRLPLRQLVPQLQELQLGSLKKLERRNMVALPEEEWAVFIA